MASSSVTLPPPPLSIATPSRDSMTFTSTKGLLNGPGQNNCFLNSAVQVLWHLDIFRRSFRDLSGHACMAEACIFCALKELFAQLQSSTETALPPDALRRALASTFFDQNRFQLGCMDDAAECFENMLVRIHAHVAPSADEDMCDARHCIPHRKFAMTLVEQSACSTCGATSEPLSYTQMVHYVSTSTLVYQVRTGSNRMNPDPFGLLLRKAGNMGDVRTCPSSCGAVIQIGRTLTNHPEIVSIGLVWNSERPTLEHIMEVFSTIGTSLRLSDVFNMVDKRWAETSIHNLVGVVTYYGKHYSTFFFHTKLRVWIYFDDATVKEIGPRWDQVVEKCRKGRYQPLLLLYALPDGTPVSTETAPKHITPLVTDKINKSTLRRSVTPSPEKPIVGNTRRAITPNPDGSPLCQKPPLPRHCNDYQNLTVIQKNIYHTDADTVDGYGLRKESEYATRKSLDFDKPQVNVHRTLSNSSSSGIEGMSDHTNTPRRRDSGNWSGDRNSASSASSTTMENPYLYLIGKVPQGAGSVPGSPTRTKSDSSSGSSGIYDAGYDSYSLSSNDSSSMTTLQHLMKMGHLAKIPEDYSNVVNQSSQSCDILCDEADELLVKSRELEDQHDLVLALALCNAAATKARAAMNAPYNNPQTLTLARMKHNTCIMRARSLHRRMTQTQPNKETPPEIRHTREGSSGSGRHSRQNSRDKSSHSRQNSRELLVPDKEKIQPTKNIEIYATLPKKRDSLKNKLSVTTHDDAEYVLYDKPSGRESRSIFSRSKNKDQKAREKRSRSEDRNKISRDFSIAPEIITGKDTLKKTKEEKEEKKEKDGKSKKQHKIRRKLLMGGLIKRKNRSMPDLTDANVVNDGHHNQAPTSSVDDSNVGLKDSFQMQSSCGYLSEGHLEFTGCNPNPNLERSKLMRKSFHGSAGKILTAAKVPPPPPLRTTSQLSKTKSYGEVDEDNPVIDINSFQETHDYHYMNQAPVSLPYYNNNSFSDESFYNETPTTIVTRADVHQELNPSKETCNADNGVDEVDCLPSHLTQPNLDLPPYPSPMGSVVHSRQASEDFPPPPPPLDLSALDEHLPQANQNPSTLLSELQNKRQEILSQTADLNKLSSLSFRSSGDTWLRELQAKQAALRNKKNQNDTKDGVDVVNTQRYLPGEPKSVKDLASKFEGSDSKNFVQVAKPEILKNDNNNNNGVLSMKKREEHDTIGPEQIAEEIREVEMLRAAVHKTLNVNQEGGDDGKKKLTKKKSVSFCDQVILVATADEQEDDSYIPNPILERVLRTAMNNPEAAAIKQEIISLRENLEQNGNNENLADNETYIHPLYVRRNSVDNLLSKNTQLNIEQQRRNNANYAAQVQSSMPQNNNATMSCSVQNQYHNEQMNVCDQSLQSGSQQYCNPQIQYSHPNLTRQSSYNDIYNPYGRTHVPQSPEIVNQQFNYNTQNCQYTYETQCPPNCSAGQNYNIQTPYRQSPYQLVPQNSHAYATHYNNNGNKIANHPQQLIMRNGMGQTRQTTPSPMNGVYSSTPPSVLHPPSPSPSNGNVNYNYLQQAYRYDNQNSAFPKCPTPAEGTNRNVNENILHNSSYQRIPVDHQSNSRQQSEYMLYQKAPLQSTDQQRNLPVDYVQNGSYQRLPPTSGEGLHNYIRTQQHPAYQMGPNQTEVYQRVPPTHCDQDMSKYSPYQHVLPPKMNLKKSVTFDPTTKGGSELGTPRPVVTPIIVNNSHNSIPTDKTKCNLCRKKNVAASNLYCQDCEFYMSRFKPRS